jgi:hypothetical protein
MSEKYLGIDASELEVKGGLNTAREIARQPLVWRKTYDLVTHPDLTGKNALCNHVPIYSFYPERKRW